MLETSLIILLIGSVVVVSIETLVVGGSTVELVVEVVVVFDLVVCFVVVVVEVSLVVVCVPTVGFFTHMTFTSLSLFTSSQAPRISVSHGYPKYSIPIENILQDTLQGNRKVAKCWPF